MGRHEPVCEQTLSRKSKIQSGRQRAQDSGAGARGRGRCRMTARTVLLTGAHAPPTRGPINAEAAVHVCIFVWTRKVPERCKATGSNGLFWGAGLDGLEMRAGNMG